MKKYSISVLALGTAFFGFSQKVSESMIVSNRQFATEIPAEKPTTTPTYKAGGDVIWSNDFSNASDWTINNDGATGAGFGWDIGTTEQSWAFNTVINSTSDGAFAELNNGNPTLSPGTQLLDVTYTLTTAAPIDVNTLSGGPNNYILEFMQYGARFNDAQEVYISTDGVAWTLVGDNSDMEVYSANGGAPYANPTVKSINLSGFIPGGTNSLWIRFSWTTAYPSQATNPNVWVTYGWMIDDVRILEAFADEFKINEVFTHDIFNAWDYYETPTAQAVPSTIGISIKNDGGTAQTKTIDVNFDLGGTSVYTATTPAVTLQPGESDTVWFTTSYTASTVGTYTITATLPADGVLTNNTGTADFKVTDFVYGHNHALSTAKLSFTDEELIGIGNIYEINANQELKAIDVAFASGTTAGIYVDVFVYEVVAGSIQDPGNFDVVNFTYQVPTPAPVSGITTIQLPTPTTLEAGKMYFAIVMTSQTATEKLAIKTSAAGDADFSTVCYGPFGTGNAVNYFVGWGVAPAVKLNFDPSVGINEESGTVALSEVYPNPTSGTTTVDFSLLNNENVKVLVLDASGRIVKTVLEGAQAAGDHSVSFEADFASGVYYVNIVTEGTTVTKKFIKK
ncbi:MAG: T9SS type A sorting domain-containing protein [Bacteroidetes bacterium]|nr:MAG: T9SS type A sorting domain-containing protein [Bacteroidota bacterium]